MKKFSTLIAALAITLAFAAVTNADNGNGNDQDCTDAICSVLQADANCDGIITATDVSYMLQVAVHLIDPNDIPCCAELDNQDCD